MYSARAPRTSRHFYPRPPRGGRPFQPPGRPVHLPISIHALREEGDGKARSPSPSGDDFYPRPPRGGRRRPHFHRCTQTAFLSTPSARRATSISEAAAPDGVSISIHALREEGDLMRELAIRIKDISIHALREEGDLERRCAIAGWPISIHALREEGDVFFAFFNPFAGQFLSTPSARRATFEVIPE